MRSVLSLMCGVVAAACLALSLPLWWVGATVEDEQGFVDATAQVVSDPAVQEATAKLVVSRIMAQAQVPERLVSRVQRGVTTALETGLESATPQAREAWQETLRASHRGWFATPTPTVWTIEAAPLAAFAMEGLPPRLANQVEPPESVEMIVSSRDPGPIVSLIDGSKERAMIVSLAGLAAFGLCVAAARRSATALVSLGLVGLLVSGVLYVLGRSGAGYAIDRIFAGDELTAAMGQALADTLAASFLSMTLWSAAISAMVLVAGFILSWARER